MRRVLAVLAAVILTAAFLQANSVWADSGTGARIAQEACRLVGKYPYSPNPADCSQNPCNGYAVCTDVAAIATSRAGVAISDDFCACTQMRQAQGQLRFFKGEAVPGGNDKLRRHFEPVGSPNPPAPGDILLYGNRHVAVVVQTVEDNGHIGLETVEANGGGRSNINRQSYTLEKRENGGWYFSSGRNHSLISGWGVIDEKSPAGFLARLQRKLQQAYCLWQAYQQIRRFYAGVKSWLPWALAAFFAFLWRREKAKGQKTSTSPWRYSYAKFWNRVLFLGLVIGVEGLLGSSPWLVSLAIGPVVASVFYLAMRSQDRKRRRRQRRPFFPLYVGEAVVAGFRLACVLWVGTMLFIVPPDLGICRPDLPALSGGKLSEEPSMAQKVRVIRRIAREEGVPEELGLAKLYAESGLDPKARSYAGALGIGQVVPRYHPTFDTSRWDDWQYNARYALRFYRSLYDRYGDWRKATWHYYSPAEAGEGARIVERLMLRPPRLLWKSTRPPWWTPGAYLGSGVSLDSGRRK